jgi:hypothetical protein
MLEIDGQLTMPISLELVTTPRGKSRHVGQRRCRAQLIEPKLNLHGALPAILLRQETSVVTDLAELLAAECNVHGVNPKG